MKGIKMSPEGEVKLFDDMTEEEKKKAVAIPHEEIESIKKMNRQQRRKWYRDQAKKDQGDE